MHSIQYFARSSQYLLSYWGRRRITRHPSLDEATIKILDTFAEFKDLLHQSSETELQKYKEEFINHQLAIRAERKHRHTVVVTIPQKAKTALKNAEDRLNTKREFYRGRNERLGNISVALKGDTKEFVKAIKAQKALCIQGNSHLKKMEEALQPLQEAIEITEEEAAASLDALVYSEIAHDTLCLINKLLKSESP